MDGWMDGQTPVTYRAPHGEKSNYTHSEGWRTCSDVTWLQPHLQAQEETQAVAPRGNNSLLQGTFSKCLFIWCC